MALELPLLLYRPIPGQEQQNAKYLVKSNAAVLARTQNDLLNYLDTLLSGQSNNELQFMKENARRIKKPNVAETIVNILLKTNYTNTRKNVHPISV